MTEAATEDPPPLSFNRMDIEKKLGFPAGRFTQPGPVLPILLATALTVGLYAALLPLKQLDLWIARTFTERGAIPYAIVLFTAWALMILLIKRQKIAVQRRPLREPVVPREPEFALSFDSVHHVLDRLYEKAEDPKQFILYNRILIALSNLRNMGKVGDVDDVLRSQAEQDESVVESSYTVVRGLIWAIPVLGFIGTVLGLSDAIGSFTAVLSDTTSMANLKPALQDVTDGLATAFETTLQGLTAALVVQMVMTLVRRSEEQMLDDFMEHCQRDVVGRLRLRSSPEAQTDETAIP